MLHIAVRFTVALFCSCLFMLAGCAGPQKSRVATYNDPFAYCAAAGTIDAPDSRYAGDPVPDSIVRGLVRQGIIAADAPASFSRNAVWRCMNGRVWVCHFGANIPCLEKADTSQTPTPAMEEFCRADPSAEDIPAAVTGRATVYAWRCAGGRALADRRVLSPDPAGFLSEFWHELRPK